MGGIWKDLLFGLRLLARSPGFALAAGLSLALGIGANTAMFSVVYGLLLRPFAVRDPGRLLAIETRKEGLEGSRGSYPNYEDLRDHCEPLEGVLASSYWPVSVMAGDRPVVVLGLLVSGNYFDVLGVAPHLGRTLRQDDVLDDGERAVAVISHRLWNRHFGSDPAIVGRKLRVNRFPFTVVGVGPPGFRGVTTGFATDLWVPVTMSAPLIPGRQSIHSRASGWLDYTARLAPGIKPRQAQAALDVLAARLSRDHPDENRGTTFRLIGGVASRFPIVAIGQGVTAFLSVMMGLVGIVLAIACANVANLLLVRGVGREQEIALRFAMGAGRGRVLRQLLTESVAMSVVAGAVGLLVAAWLLELWNLVDPPAPLPLDLQVGLDPVVLWFTLAVSAGAGLAFGALPALRNSRLRLIGSLRDRWASSGGGPRQSRLQAALVSAQVAAALVLLVMTVLFLRTARMTLRLDPGFDVDKQIVASLNLSYGGYSEPQGRAFLRRLQESVKQLPGVGSTAFAVLAPVSYGRQTMEIVPEGYPAAVGGRRIFADFNSVSAGYFDTLGIPILRGRAIQEWDREGAGPVAVINQTLALRYWAGRDPIGSAFRIGKERIRIVGVAGDGKYFQLSDPPLPYFYLPYDQHYAPFVTLHVRTRDAPAKVLAGVGRAISELDPALPPCQLNTMARHLETSQYPTTIGGVLAGGFGLLALVLALIGIYGVMAYAVRQRTQEFGVRTALGARQSEIIWMVIRRGARIALAGVAIGIVAAAALSRALSGRVVLDRPNDPLLFAAIAALLFTAVMLACYVPARSATKLNPAQALRHE
ncbi:MAG: ABC transporter permease [Bryobacteraceae bacterium]|nr:ABC transporter permease [Bryobacteraceae bacterium]